MAEIKPFCIHYTGFRHGLLRCRSCAGKGLGSFTRSFGSPVHGSLGADKVRITWSAI